MAFSDAVKDSPVAEINITPLVDVMLVLLVIFMITMPILAQPVDATLPQVARPDSVEPPPSLRLQVNDAGDFLLDGRVYAADALWQRFEEAAAEDPRTALRVSATSSADYQHVVTALAEARERGLRNIAVQP